MSRPRMRAAIRKGNGNSPTSDARAIRPGGHVRRSSLLCTIVAAGMLGGKVAAATADSKPFRTDAGSTARLLRSGTAFFVTPAGELLTSGHIVRGCRQIDVWPDEASRLGASLEAIDTRLDVALLATHRRVSRIAVLRAGRVSRHDAAFTIGYGLTASTPMQPVITRGRIDAIVDGKARRFLVMQAMLYEGNSGGPVLDEHGRLIGMVVGRYVSRPDRAVAIDASELARFLGTRAAPPPRSSTDHAPGEGPRQTLREISALVQCAD
jgi:S1-C subfamily serine protease